MLRSPKPVPVALFALLAARAAPAQVPGPGEMQQLLEQLQSDPRQFERLVARAQAMQSCMARIDPAALERLRARTGEMGTELRAVCAAGRREEAARRAVEFAREMSAEPGVHAVEACGDFARELLAELPFALPGESGDGVPAHVCDQLTE